MDKNTIKNRVATGIATRDYGNKITYGKKYNGHLSEIPTGSNQKYYVFYFVCDQKMNASVSLFSLQDNDWMNINLVTLNTNIEIL